MRVLIDPDQTDLNAVLAKLLEEDVDITAPPCQNELLHLPLLV